MDLLTEHLTLAEDPLHTIRLVIADGHQLVREGVKRVVAVDPGIVVVGESADLAATLEVVAATRPDVLLLDLSLSPTHELDALRAVTERFAGMPVLVLSSHSEEQFGIAALRLGASGYLCKSLAADVIVKAIRKAHAGGRYLSDTLAELLADKLASPHPRLPHELLTEREHNVLRLLALGSPVKQVAGKLDISVSSVNTYRGRIFAKLRIKSNAELIRYAMRHRLVS
jgi:DNA-binding NarL/FixJ family response regulator